MGLLKNVLKDAITSGTRKVSNSVSTGIANGVGKAMSAAAEKITKPAADKLAENAAGKINEAASSLDTVAEALNEAAGQVKICPKCGDPSPATQTFCEKCGTRLPELTLAQQNVCPKCGKAFLPGAAFCSGCGSRLPEYSVPAAAPAAPAAGISAGSMTDSDAAGKIRKVLAESFPQFEVKENVSPTTLGGSGRFMNYSFGVYFAGMPRLFIMLVGKTTCSTRLYRWSREQALKSSVTMINFVEHYPNEPEYIRNRLKQYL